MRANAAQAIGEAFRFVVWAQSLRRQPTIQEIADKWGCSRATAYRYRNAIMDAMGAYIEPSPQGATLPLSHKVGRDGRIGRTALRRAAA